MPPRFSAGADWSGKPYETGDLFLFCVVALSDVAAWDETCGEIRRKLRMTQGQEFHGHKMKGDSQRLELLQAGQNAGMRVGVFISHNKNIEAETKANKKVALTHQGVALDLLSRFLPLCPLQIFWFDEGDLKGKKAEKAFATQVCRLNRTFYPTLRLEARCRKAEDKNLIQLADVMAYSFRTQERGTLKNPQLKSLLKEIEEDERNLIIRG